MANTCNFYTFYVCPNSRCIYLQCRKKKSIGKFDKQAVNVRIPVLKSSKVNIPPDWKIHNLRTRFHALSATIEQQLFP